MTAEGEIIEIWPRCPECHTNRQAACLICGTNADFFPAAHQVDEQSEPMHMCSGCDDVAELRFFRHCHRCDHDFGDGYLPPARELADEQDQESRLAWVLLLGLIAGSAAIMGYFSWLVRR